MDTTVFPGCEASLRSDVLAYAAKRYGSRPEALWRTHPRHAVLRRPDSQKWYALVMDVQMCIRDSCGAWTAHTSARNAARW